MAARRGAFSFSRSARSAFNSFRNNSSTASQTTRARRTRIPFENGSPITNRRRFAETMIPLHNAVASAKLVTHLSVSSRSCRALSPGALALLWRPSINSGFAIFMVANFCALSVL